MSSSTAKHGPEIARQLDADRLLAYQIHANQAEIRERRIARVSRLWDQRKLLGKCIAAGAALVESRRAADSFSIRIHDALDAAGFGQRRRHGNTRGPHRENGIRGRFAAARICSG